MFRHPLFPIFATVILAIALPSCGSNNPSAFRVLTGITVTPATADARSFTNGQVQFTANGTFSLPPSPALVTSAPPYSGQFTVDNTNIATVVASGMGTITVQCVSGASGTVNVVAIASANNRSHTVISGSGQLTCP